MRFLLKKFCKTLTPLQNSHWTQLMGHSLRRPRSDGSSTLSDHETKRREAVWELFHSEVVYLMSHLLVLKEVRTRNLTRGYFNFHFFQIMKLSSVVNTIKILTVFTEAFSILKWNCALCRLWQQKWKNCLKENDEIKVLDLPSYEGCSQIMYELKKLYHWSLAFRYSYCFYFGNDRCHTVSSFLFLKVFLEPLKEIQQMGHLQHVDVNKIFCNVHDLCEVRKSKPCL